jgi:DNA polymerase-4
VIRAVLHVDMDAFYASVEEHDDPTLVGKPLIVGGVAGRGVVAAASYEVRKYGVHSAMPISTALRLCPHAICVRPRMQRYKEVSDQVFSVFHQITPLVQGLSLDEAFLDVTASQELFGDSVVIARRIKARIRELTGLTASVGVATNKLVAKIASDLDKPDGLTLVPEDRLREVLDPLSVLRERAAGIDDRPVVPEHDEKSLSAEDTFERDIGDPRVLQAELTRLAGLACERLRRKQLMAGCIGVKIRRADFVTFTRQRAVAPPTHDGRTIANVARELFARWLAGASGAKLRLLGVVLSDLSPASQLGLFEDTPHTTRLDAALDEARARFGSGILRRGNTIK